MTYNFNIIGRLNGNNEFIKANRSNPYLGNRMKQDAEDLVCWYIKTQLRGVHIKKQIHISYLFVEKNQRRDKDNIASFGMKVIQDALVTSGVINNDGWKNIKSFDCDFAVDKDNPRIEVELIEVGD